jgi:hypothetical protein
MIILLQGKASGAIKGASSESLQRSKLANNAKSKIVVGINL